MVKFAVKSLIFIIPFLLIIAVEVFIDPFNFFFEEKDPDMLSKKDNMANKTNPYLYKIIEFDRHPNQTIILGDSRMDELSPVKFLNEANEKVSNLAVGAGTIQDAVEILKYVSGKHEIKKIYWGVSIETYNGTRLRNRATQSIEIRKSFPLYLLNRYTFSSTMLIIQSMLSHEQVDLYKPPFSKEEFWQNQLDLSARYLANYTYPDNYYSELKQISEECLKKDIKLIFIVSPTHVDLQNKIHENNLDELDKKFKNDIQSFGDVYDFNYPNVITNDKNNFNDPFHFKDSVSNIIVREIAANKVQYSKYSALVK
jgi:hypothetical protein